MRASNDSSSRPHPDFQDDFQDERDGVRTVYLPTYRCRPLDDSAKRIWRRLGFRVVAVDALGPALHGGAIHCLSHVTRDPATLEGKYRTEAP